MKLSSKEDEILFKHFKDLIELSYQRMIPAYSNFVGFHELSFGFLALEEFYGKNHYYEGTHFQLFGGYQEAERKLFCFMNPEQGFAITEQDFPVRCLQIVPVNKKFGEALNHRDYLGTILGLGLTRNQIGDILVERDPVFSTSSAYVFCKEDKTRLISELERIRHTTVKVTEIAFQETGWKPSFREICTSVASFRIDVILSSVLKLSRSQALSLIQSSSVIRNGRICTENAKMLEAGDRFSVRGYGKFIFEEKLSRSKKGKYQVKIKQYI